MINWEVMLPRLAKRATDYMEGEPVGNGLFQRWCLDQKLDADWQTEEDLWSFSLLPLIKSAIERSNHTKLSRPVEKLMQDVIVSVATPHFRLIAFNDTKHGMMLGIEVAYGE